MKSITILAHPSDIYYENIKKFLKYKKLSNENASITVFWSTFGIGLSLSKNSVFDLLRSLYADKRNFKNYKTLFLDELGIKIIKIHKVPLYVAISLLMKSIHIFYKIYGNVSELRSLQFKEIKYGDLVYYSFIKFGVKEKIYFNSFFLFFLIYRSLCSFYNLELEKKNKTLSEMFISNYTSYLQHGLPSRFYADSGVQCFSIASNELSMVIKHKTKSSNQNKDWKNYKNLLSSISKEDLKEYRSKAEVDLSSRFKGKIDTGIHYMKVSPYSSGISYKYGIVDGVIFLHDFFDSCDDFDGNIFYDIYDWAYQSLEYVQQNDLNIIVKPHPNSVKKSKIFEKMLQKEFSSVKWLDRNTNNADIFKNTKAGISMFGSVFAEIAYHNLIPIAAGSHPADEFDFTYQPSNKEEYFALIKNLSELKPITNAKSKVIDFYIAHNYLNSSNEFFI